MTQGSSRPVVDLRGGLRLVVDATRGATGIVQDMHGTIVGGWPLSRPERRRPPVAGLVYRTIDGGAKLIGSGLDALIAPFEGLLPAVDSPRRDAVVSALNGVLGDHLRASGNPLALTMHLRRHGDAHGRIAPATGRVVVLVHGLCLNDHGWLRNGHDHGQALATDLGYTPVYARYNSGLHISENGQALHEHLETLVRSWPVPVHELVLLGHSMGGLVIRSAVAQADAGDADAAAHCAWRRVLRRMVFLGTPHQGAPLERAGNWLQRLLELSPYAAPIARLSRLRSDGITDLRHGDLLASDWGGRQRYDPVDRRAIVPLPAGVACHVVASTAGGHRVVGSLLGDGLVPVDSALGRHARPERTLALPQSHQWVGHGIHHLDLMSSPAVYRRLRRWLA